MIGLDIEKAKTKIADDEFARERARTGMQPIFSNWRKHLAETGQGQPKEELVA
jgi:hypothetical protein